MNRTTVKNGPNSSTKNSWALFNAVKTGQEKEVKRLLAAGADPNTWDRRRTGGDTPFLEACFRGHTNIVKAMLQHGADVNAKDKYGATALHYACFKKNCDIARLLLERRAEVNTRDCDGRSPLYDLIRNDGREHDIIHILIERGSDLTIAGKDDGNTPLHWACFSENIGSVRLLLEHGADAEASNKPGLTPFDLALRVSDENARGEILDLFREYAPELYFSRFCTLSLSNPGGI